MKLLIQLLASTVVVAAISSPVFALAQSSQDDLRNAIQASVMSDPRVASIPPVQLKALVDSLYAQAQAQHMTAADILWQPYHADAATIGSGGMSVVVCASGWQGYLCNFNKAFGFEGDSWDIPIIMLVVSGLLIAVIWEMIAHHRKAVAAKVSVPPSMGAMK